jgi:hypothetical protein
MIKERILERILAVRLAALYISIRLFCITSAEGYSHGLISHRLSSDLYQIEIPQEI